MKIQQSKNCQILGIVENEGKHIIVCGKYQVTSKTFNNAKECEEYIKNNPIEICFNLINIVIFYEKDIKKDMEQASKEVC